MTMSLTIPQAAYFAVRPQFKGVFEIKALNRVVPSFVVDNTELDSLSVGSERAFRLNSPPLAFYCTMRMRQNTNSLPPLSEQALPQSQSR
jgi:hypothetical protein